MRKIIPILCWLAALGGFGGLMWYRSLTEQEREEADRLAAEYAQTLYQRAVEQLSDDQARNVNRLVRLHFGS